MPEPHAAYSASPVTLTFCKNMSLPKISDALLVVGSIILFCTLPFILILVFFFTPILFYGKVVDENNVPVPEATVQLSYCSNLGPGEGHNKTKTATDKDGLFFDWGLGLGVVVNVTKKGYQTLPESGGCFAYSGFVGKTDLHSTSKTRAIFVIGSPAMKPSTARASQ